jgi:hypothetical protein
MVCCYLEFLSLVGLITESVKVSFYYLFNTVGNPHRGFHDIVSPRFTAQRFVSLFGTGLQKMYIN